MAAIASITNGEAMSSVRTKLNSVITEINILDPVDWIDYSATSTIVGWSSFTTKIIRYRVIGKQIFVMFNFNGVSNSTTTTFTLPNSASNSAVNYIFITNNGVAPVNPGRLVVSGNTATMSIDNTGNTFTASGTKITFGQIFIEIA